MKIELPAQMLLETQIQLLQLHFPSFPFSTFENIIPDSIPFSLHHSFDHFLHHWLRMKIKKKLYSTKHVAIRHSAILNYSRLPTKAMLVWLGAYTCNWLAIFLCLVVTFRPRFHSDYLAPLQLPYQQEAVEALLVICILKLQQEIIGWQ